MTTVCQRVDGVVSNDIHSRRFRKPMSNLSKALTASVMTIEDTRDMLRILLVEYG
jgi:hypothetical protein